MGKKSENTEEITLTETAEQVQPVKETAPAMPTKPGYITINLKGASGKGIIVHSRQYGEGKLYTPEKWELVSEAKKK